MKKVLVLFTSIMILLGLVGCSARNVESSLVYKVVGISDDGRYVNVWVHGEGSDTIKKVDVSDHSSTVNFKYSTRDGKDALLSISCSSPVEINEDDTGGKFVNLRVNGKYKTEATISSYDSVKGLFNIYEFDLNQHWLSAGRVETGRTENAYSYRESLVPLDFSSETAPEWLTDGINYSVSDSSFYDDAVWSLDGTDYVKEDNHYVAYIDWSMEYVKDYENGEEDVDQNILRNLGNMVRLVIYGSNGGVEIK